MCPFSISVGVSMSLDSFTKSQLEKIGFSYLMEHLTVLTVYGRDLKNDIKPYFAEDADILKREISYLDRFVDIYRNQGKVIDDIKIALSRFKEIRGIINRLENGSATLNEVELFELKCFSFDMGELINAYRLIDFEFDGVSPVFLEKVIAILNPDETKTRSFHISDLYSKDLAEIRKAKRRLESEKSGEKKSRNKIIQAEKEEELKVKRMLTEKLRPFCDDLQKNIEFIGKLDFLIAKAHLAIKFNGTKPNWTESKEMNIDSAINPFVASILSEDGRSFVPISICLKQGANVLTGANMGGKSVALATITLNLLLAHCGFFVFAKEISTKVLDYIFYLAEDYQSVNEGLSTFGAEVMQIEKAVELAVMETGLLVVDEFAKGTNPEEGEIIVRAFARFCDMHNSFCMVSTHYSNVIEEGMNHFQVVGLKNTDLEKYSGSRVKPNLQGLMDFRIEKVEWNSPPPKDAVRVAELLGIQRFFLEFIRTVREEIDGDSK